MSVALTPRVQMLAVCDKIQESTKETGVFHVKGIRQQILAASFPFAPKRLWLFFVFSYSRSGEFPCYVRVVNDQTDRTVYFTYLNPTPTFDSGGYWMGGAPIRCLFPEPGRYTVEVCFFQEHGIDVLKGEMHFWVIDESE